MLEYALGAWMLGRGDWLIGTYDLKQRNLHVIRHSRAQSPCPPTTSLPKYGRVRRVYFFSSRGSGCPVSLVKLHTIKERTHITVQAHVDVDVTDLRCSPLRESPSPGLPHDDDEWLEDVYGAVRGVASQ